MPDTSAWQLQEAKNKLSELVSRAIAGSPQLITRNGKPVVYVVAAADYEATAYPSIKKTLLARPHRETILDLPARVDTGREWVL